MIISTKIGQTSFVNENGTRVSATVLDYNSCTVVGNRTIDRDGYLANIIGFLKPKKLNKPQLKEFNKLNLEPKKIIKEQRINSDEELLEVGSSIDPKFKILSIGMSDDYNIALKNGSNMIRIGSKIFGKRNY